MQHLSEFKSTASILECVFTLPPSYHMYIPTSAIFAHLGLEMILQDWGAGTILGAGDMHL